MKFCENCGNMLFPNGKKLYCKACENFYDLDISDYKIVKTINHNDGDFAPIVVRQSSSKKISPEDRKAHEDYFGS